MHACHSAMDSDCADPVIKIAMSEPKSKSDLEKIA